MTDLAKPPYMDLTKTLRRAISAHDAVLLGIATAAEKERDRRQQAYHKQEAERKLQAGIVKQNAAVSSDHN